MGGAERSVDSGFIDITDRDLNGVTVVIELKTGTASQRAIAQILSYMGDILNEEGGSTVRGILVASDFDFRARSAARMVPNLLLKRYKVEFSFTDCERCGLGLFACRSAVEYRRSPITNSSWSFSKCSSRFP